MIATQLSRSKHPSSLLRIAAGLLAITVLASACAGGSDDPRPLPGSGGVTGNGGRGEAGKGGNAAAGGSSGLGGATSSGGGGQVGGDAGSDGAPSVPGGDAGLPTSDGRAMEVRETGAAEAPLPATALGVNDVSYLFPLPKTVAEINNLLAVDPKIAGPTLLTDAMMTTALKEGFFVLGGDGFRSELRVVGLRLDPCAAVTAVPDPATCRSEVRLVAQPVRGSGGVVSTTDIAMHLLYQVTRADLDALLAGLLALKPGNENLSALPLGPHPLMVKQGLAGAFAKGTNALILKHVAPAKLLKVATMSVSREPDEWDFVQFEVRAGNLIAQNIAGLHDAGNPSPRMFISITSLPGGRRYSSTPPDEAIGFPEALRTSTSVQQLSPEALKAALGRLGDIENPAKSSVEKVDCASCHFGIEARAFYEGLTKTKTTLSFVAPPGQNIVQSVPANGAPGNTRAFGYIDQKVSVSQRVINESARVADWFLRGVR
ncbi:MAG TPA: hypothetical protein VGG33_02015 [Polyangia bacterium]